MWPQTPALRSGTYDLLRNFARWARLRVDGHTGRPRESALQMGRPRTGSTIHLPATTEFRKRPGQHVAGMNLRRDSPIMTGTATPLSCPRVPLSPEAVPLGRRTNQMSSYDSTLKCFLVIKQLDMCFCASAKLELLLALLLCTNWLIS